MASPTMPNDTHFCVRAWAIENLTLGSLARAGDRQATEKSLVLASQCAATARSCSRRMRRSSARCCASAIFHHDNSQFICRSTDRSALPFPNSFFYAKVLLLFTTYPVMPLIVPSESAHGPSRSDSTICGRNFSPFDLISKSTSHALMVRLLVYRSCPHPTRQKAIESSDASPRCKPTLKSLFSLG